MRRRDESPRATAIRVLQKHCLRNDDRYAHGSPQARTLGGCTCDTWARDLVLLTIVAERRRAVRLIRAASGNADTALDEVCELILATPPTRGTS